LVDSDRDFLTSWRDELLAHAWTALERFERDTGQPYFTVLRYRADHPDLRSPQMAEEFELAPAEEAQFFVGPAIAASGPRKVRRFAARGSRSILRITELSRLEQELIDLQLWEYCRPALERQKKN